MGLFFQKNNLILPDAIQTAIMDLSRVATPMAFLLLGGRFHIKYSGSKIYQIGIILLYKLWIFPLMVLPVCVYGLHLGKVEIIPLFIFVSAPTAITTFQLAEQYGADVDLAGDIVIYSILFSIITMFFWIIIQKRYGWI